jgi:hypothetical protein
LRVGVCAASACADNPSGAGSCKIRLNQLGNALHKAVQPIAKYLP